LAHGAVTSTQALAVNTGYEARTEEDAIGEILGYTVQAFEEVANKVSREGHQQLSSGR
jgi:hypothetical protein